MHLRGLQHRCGRRHIAPRELGRRGPGVQLTADKTALNAPATPKDAQRQFASGHLTVGRDMAPGEYVMQVIVTDKSAKGKFNVASQSVDFEIKD